MSNIVHYRAPNCGGISRMAVCQCGSTLKYHIIGNFFLQTSMGAEWGWCCIRV